MGSLGRALVAVGAAMLLAPATGAARTWGTPTALPAEATFPALAPLPAGGEILVYQPDSGGLAARTVDSSGALTDEQELSPTPAATPSVATDDAGEAAVAWYDWGTSAVEVDVRGADGSVAASTAFAASFLAVQPRLAMSPAGWAAVAFVGNAPDGTHTFVSIRPPGGAFAPPVEATPDGQGDPQLPSSIAVDDRGEVVVGYAQGGVPHAAIRTAGALGSWQAAQTLGAAYLDPYPAGPLPLVGIAADGGAVAVWEEAGGQNIVAPVLASFRPPGGAFAAAQDLGVDTWDGAAPQLAVSAHGEVILVVSQAIQADVGVGLLPAVVFSGATDLGHFAAPEQLSYDWVTSEVELGMNARGDAVVAYADCCRRLIETRRREPFGPFGAEQDVPVPAGGGYNLLQLSGVAVDPFGNATLAWLDFATSVPQQKLLADAPVLTAAPPVAAPPASAGPTDLVPAPPPTPQGYGTCTSCFLTPPGFTWWPLLPVTPAVAPAPPATSSGPTRPSRAPDGPLAIAVIKLPAVTGPPRIAVAVRCPWACRAEVSATLVTPGRRRLRLPRVALTLDAAGVGTARLRLTTAAARALRVPAAGAAGRLAPRRRFTLSLTATAGDRSGAPESVSIALAFVRR